MPNDHDNTNPPAPEWREFWNTEEIVQEGDECINIKIPNDTWDPVECPIGAPASKYPWLRFRRRVAPAPDAAPVIAEAGEVERLRAELADVRAERDREIAVAVAFEAEAAKLRIARAEAERDEVRRALDAVVRGLERVVWSNPSPTIPAPTWPTAPAPYCPPAFPNYPVVTFTGDPLPPMPETVCGAGQNTNQKA